MRRPGTPLNLLLFFVLAFAITWPGEIWGPQAGLAGAAIGLVSGAGPLLSAVMLTAVQGKAAVVQLLRPLGYWRASLRWYAVSLFGLGALAAIAALLAIPVSGWPDFAHPYAALLLRSPATLAWVLLPVAFIASALSTVREEVGWRGYALPRLQSRMSATAASLLLGTLWGLWHLPLFFQPGAAQAGIPIPAFLVFIVAASVIMTWLYNNTEGSLVLAALFHGSVNVAIVYMPILPQSTGNLLAVLLFVALTVLAAAVIVVKAGPARLGPPSPTTTTR
jgi:uncharacterized protein